MFGRLCGRVNTHTGERTEDHPADREQYGAHAYVLRLPRDLRSSRERSRQITDQ
jgi:hypothetical protein